MRNRLTISNAFPQATGLSTRVILSQRRRGRISRSVLGVVSPLRNAKHAMRDPSAQSASRGMTRCCEHWVNQARATWAVSRAEAEA